MRTPSITQTDFPHVAEWQWSGRQNGWLFRRGIGQDRACEGGRERGRGGRVFVMQSLTPESPDPARSCGCMCLVRSLRVAIAQLGQRGDRRRVSPFVYAFRLSPSAKRDRDRPITQLYVPKSAMRQRNSCVQAQNAPTILSRGAVKVFHRITRNGPSQCGPFSSGRRHASR